MKVSPISQSQGISFRGEKKVNPVTWTGYGAIAFGVASAVTGNKKKISVHKNLAYIAGVLTLLHLGIVEYFKYKYHHNKSNA